MTDSYNELLGQQVDQYQILRHIARGGMADVYLAQDVDLQRKVALKVMLDTLAAADPQFGARFRREAQMVAKLDHPNIVQVYNVGRTPANQPYIAMQYIEGGSLRDKLKELAEREKLLTTEQALNIARQIALALGAAHQAGIVHRDMKPANVLIRSDGTPVLVDLGIAA
ncbi:MAG TPA: serine/threonine protein kinase, partial [Anaerolineae bacterium]|nr:serine/threonine protein kinase [Anaerolineae bacterium]